MPDRLTWASAPSTRQSRHVLRAVRRQLYLTQRALGDLDAASRGPAPLAQRLTRRVVRRTLLPRRHGWLW